MANDRLAPQPTSACGPHVAAGCWWLAAAAGSWQWQARRAPIERRCVFFLPKFRCGATVALRLAKTDSSASPAETTPAGAQREREREREGEGGG
jgi:hypothetical protein